MNVYMLSTLFCLAFVFVTIELIRRSKLQERYAILWLLLGLVMSLFSIFPKLLHSVSKTIGIHYAPSVLFLIGLMFSLVFVMHITIVISKLHRKVTRLVQELALLRLEHEKKRGEDTP